MAFHNNGNYFTNSGTVYGGVCQQQGMSAKQDHPGEASLKGHAIAGPTVGSGQDEREAESDRRNAFSYDVALSYAGEQEKLVRDVARILEAEGLRVFFAPDCGAEFIGEDMIQRFYRIYRYESLFVAAFVTEDYVRKDITLHEAATAMLRQREEGRNCLIPIYFGSAVLPRLAPNINYIPADGLLAVELADRIRAVVLNPDRRPV